MRITKCHAENFGKLRDFDFTPASDGLSVIEESNGFGKTTFSYFIKAMLYGLSPSKKASLAENERKRFAPWQSGVFGGYIEFTAGGRSWRIERVFGSKESADVCTVYDLDRGTVTDELSAVPGLVLLGVDADTFERTCFFSDRKLSPQGSGAVVGRLASLIENYDYSAADDTTDAAIELLRDRRREIKPLRGVGGETGEVAARLSECRTEYTSCKEAARKREALSRAIAEEDRAIADAAERSAEVETALKTCRTALGDESKRQLLRRLRGDLAESAASLDAGREFFAAERPPERDLLDGLASVISDRRAKCAVRAERAAELAGLESELEAHPELSAALSVSNADIENGERAASACAEAHVELDGARAALLETECAASALAAEYPQGFPSENELSSAAAAHGEMKRTSLLLAELEGDAKRISVMRAEAERLREAKRAEERARKGKLRVAAIALAAASVALVLLAIILGISQAVGTVMLVLGLICLPAAAIALALSLGRRGEQSDSAPSGETAEDDRLARYRLAYTEAESSLSEFKKKYLPDTDTLGEDIFYRMRAARERHASLEAELSVKRSSLESLKTALAAAETALSEALARDRIALESPIYPLRARAAYAELRETRMRADRIARRADACRAELAASDRTVATLTAAALEALSAFPGIKLTADSNREVGDLLDLSQSLLSRRAWEYAAAIEAQKRAKTALDTFLAENPELSDAAVSPDEIRTEEARLEGVLAELSAGKDAHAARRAELLAESAGYEAIEDRAPALLGEEHALAERLDRLNHLSELYDLAMKKLAGAKESIAEKYMSGLRESFTKYTSLASPDRTLTVNNQLELSYEAHGSRRSDETMSRGERAVADLCIRLATADTVFAGETPPIIIDDAFAELDSRNLSRAHELIRDAARKYQVIYLTCRDDRAPKSN